MRKNYWFYCLVCLVISAPFAISASEVGIYTSGVSYHIGANATYPAYTRAPRKIDDNAAFVINPGIGVGHDFRDTVDQKWSWHGLALLFKDCNDRSVYNLAYGGRYRYFFNYSISGEVDLLASLYVAQDWGTSQYNTSIMPFPSLGLNYHWDKWAIGIKSTFSPRNVNHSSTGGFNILFFYFKLGYSL